MAQGQGDMRRGFAEQNKKRDMRKSSNKGSGAMTGLHEAALVGDLREIGEKGEEGKK